MNQRDAFINLATERLEHLLTGYGNELSADHRLVLREALVAPSYDLMSRTMPDARLAVAVPCGMGKTTAIRAVVWALHEMGLPYTILVTAAKVEQLCTLQRDLIADGVPEDMVGLMHSYVYNAEAVAAGSLAPGQASAPSIGHDRQVLLVAHQRIRLDQDTPEWMKRDLCYHDESLIVAEARCLPLVTERDHGLLAEIATISMLAESNPEKFGVAAGWLDQVGALLRDVLVGKAKMTNLPRLREAVILHIRERLQEIHWPHVHSLLEFANQRLRVRRGGDGGALITYRLTVPEDLSRVMILDASDPLRELIQADKSIQRVEDVRDELVSLRDGGLAKTKRFDRVTFAQMRTSGGRAKITEDLTNAQEASWVSREVSKLLLARPDESFIVFTYKAKDGVDYVSTLSKAFAKAGVELTFTDGTPRVHLLTWGMETALNSYADVPNVVLAGVLLKPMDVIEGEIVGASRDVELDVSEAKLRDLRYSEASHMVFQAANRGAMRKVDIDADGRTQALPCRVWLIHYDQDLRTRLDRVMPGVTWESWKRTEDGSTSVFDASLKVTEGLKALTDEGISDISITAFKKRFGITVSNDSWVRARDAALSSDAGWAVFGRRFARFEFA